METSPLRFRTIALGTALILALAAFAQACASFGADAVDSRMGLFNTSPNWMAGQFRNAKIAKFGLSSERQRAFLSRYLDPSVVRVPAGTVPLVENSDQTFETIPDDGVRITWVGHSTMLVEMDGVRILTDPIWSERCSPVSFAGPRRFHAPGIAIDELPHIDAVVISHDHYDHLDYPTIVALAERDIPFYVPLGIGAHLEKWDVHRFVELDWWQRANVPTASGRSLSVVATPSQHFSGRSIDDRNTTLWASWAIIAEDHRVFFGGDTGYFEGFKEIGDVLGPFDVSIQPIGAYDPAWLAIHMNPEQAVQAHLDVRARHMFPIHWGTFNLALHSYTEPAERMAREADRLGVS